jgi:hypothetical protein
MPSELLQRRGRALENAFYRKPAESDRERLRDARSKEAAQALLRRASGITDGAILSRLEGLGIGPETLAALTLIPLVEVAWADGRMEEKERHAVLSGAESMGIPKESPSHQLLRGWLEERPGPDLGRAWSEFIEAVCRELSVESRIRLRENVVGRARKVAEAAGGFLGLGSISRKEELVLAELEQAFARGERVTVHYPPQ